MDWSNISITVSSVLVGGLITAYFSRRYYVEASEDLKQESDSLKHITKQLMRMMHDAKLIEVEWDKNGDPIRVVKLSGHIAGSSSMTAKPEVKRADEPKEGEVR